MAGEDKYLNELTELVSSASGDLIPIEDLDSPLELKYITRSNLHSGLVGIENIIAYINSSAEGIEIETDNLNMSVQGWQFDGTFSSTDHNTVAWASGTLTLTDGTTFNINGANTGDIAAITYVYLDIGTSLTLFQTSTTASDAVGGGKILVAVAENVAAGKKANFQVFGGKGGVSKLIVADVIAANTITANEIAGNTITAAEIAGTTISVNELNFTPVQSTDVIAKINASAEGINIEADNVAISGSCTFTSNYDPTDKYDVTNNNADDINEGTTYGKMPKLWKHTTDATKIDGGKIYTNTIVADVIAANTITANEIAGNTITANELAVNTITATEIAVGTITGTEVASDAGLSGTQIHVTNSTVFDADVTIQGLLDAAGGIQTASGNPKLKFGRFGGGLDEIAFVNASGSNICNFGGGKIQFDDGNYLGKYEPAQIVLDNNGASILLSVVTTPFLTVEGKGTFNSTKIITGAGAGKFLQSDAAGDATWEMIGGGDITSAIDKDHVPGTLNQTVLATGSSVAGSFSVASMDAGNALEVDAIKITIGAGADKFLQSDAAGSASWADLDANDIPGTLNQTVLGNASSATGIFTVGMLYVSGNQVVGGRQTKPNDSVGGVSSGTAASTYSETMKDNANAGSTDLPDSQEMQTKLNALVGKYNTLKDVVNDMATKYNNLSSYFNTLMDRLGAHGMITTS